MFSPGEFVPRRLVPTEGAMLDTDVFAMKGVMTLVDFRSGQSCGVELSINPNPIEPAMLFREITRDQMDDRVRAIQVPPEARAFFADMLAAMDDLGRHD